MKLLIVESPAKAKTIEKYLGRDFKVLASFGHVRDLPEKELGIDIDKDFKPDYQILPKAKKTISELKKYSDKAETIYLATDLDREGEAISWHLISALKLKEDDSKVKRIVFNEITKTALERAVSKPRGIDQNLVDAQQARRILDRLVGYKLSPLLWKKVKTGLSAGRVQSVAVRLVVEREQEINDFKPTEFWVLAVDLSKKDEEKVFRAFLVEQNGKPIKKYDIANNKDAEKIVLSLEKASYQVVSLEKRDSTRKPAPPFVTSTLQMEATRKIGFSAKQTMSLAQRLYESGHITYMRTDSNNLSAEAVTKIRKTIVSKYGQKYLPEVEIKYKTKTKGAQEAHEAIRPTHFDKDLVSDDRREQSLYEMIWRRTVASQMRDALFEVVEAKILAKAKDELVFIAKGETLKFDGFIAVYTEGRDEEPEEMSGTLPELTIKEDLSLVELIKQQKFTEPPNRYTEAMLVKKLEGLGIGRPSTYAPTLSTIQDRGYTSLIEKKFHPTEIGIIVSNLLVKHFANVVDYQFTAKMENEFDEIASGERKWEPVIAEFYGPFEKNLAEKFKEIDKKDVMPEEKLDESCPDCGKGLLIKHGRFGKFVACSGYPGCKYSRPIETKADQKATVLAGDGEIQKLSEATEEKCEKCGGKMSLKEGRFGKFLACENFPKCKNTKSIVSVTGVKCPDCGDGEVVERRTKRGRLFWGCSKYPGCKYATWNNPTQIKSSESLAAEEPAEESAAEDGQITSSNQT